MIGYVRLVLPLDGYVSAARVDLGTIYNFNRWVISLAKGKAAWALRIASTCRSTTNYNLTSIGGSRDS